MAASRQDDEVEEGFEAEVEAEVEEGVAVVEPPVEEVELDPEPAPTAAPP